MGGVKGAIAAAAYRHRTAMFDAGSARTWDYSGKSDLAHAEVLLPADAPEWITSAASALSTARLSEHLWNRATIAEAKENAGQIARELIIALPIELTKEQNIALVRDYVGEVLLPRGYAVDWVFHDKPGNPHAHVMHTLRPLNARGFGPKVTPRFGADGEPMRGPPTPTHPKGRIIYDRFAGSRDTYRDMRNAWATFANKHYAMAGFDITIDMRSYEERGIAIVPQRHLGPALTAMRARGFQAEALEDFQHRVEARA
jgi:ATP-dependent exoDNAse (exonuclease V) alpha subunit